MIHDETFQQDLLPVEAEMPQARTSFLAGVDDIELPLRIDTRDIDRLERIVKREAEQKPGLRFRARRTESEASPESGLAKRFLALRRRREEVLGENLFGEPAWDMLLDLFVAHESKARMSVSDLCINAGVPPTTALRWLSSLVAQGKVVRRNDPEDRRKAHVDLAPKTVREMRRLLRSWLE